MPGSWDPCLLLSPFIFLLYPYPRVAIVVFLGSPSPFVSLYISSIRGWPLPGSWAPCLPLSPLIYPYPWVAIAGFLGSLSPFVSLHISLSVGGHCRVPRGSPSPFVSLHTDFLGSLHISSIRGWPLSCSWAPCLLLSPFIYRWPCRLPGLPVF